MTRITRAARHLSVEEVQQKVNNATSVWLRNRWMIIYTALLDPRDSGEIARQLGVSRPCVKKIVSLYKRFGPSGLETSGPGGRRNAYLTISEEEAFLAPFIEQASRGELVTTKTLQAAFAEHVGEPIDDSTVYRLLERHHWRKIVPRAYHPDKDVDAQEAFKKTSGHSLKQQLQQNNQRISGQQ